MDCLVGPVQLLKRRCSGRYGYRPLEEEEFGPEFVTVVVGKEKKEFRVDPFVLQENPFRVLIDLVNGESVRGGRRVVLVGVDAILFEHMLWLMIHDCSSLFNLNLKEILDFYAQDI
ncbi:hypothetical protein V2J09_014818 [Rumex salicifolius]